MTDEPTIATLLRALGDRFAAVSDSPRLDAELLLAFALGVRRSHLYAHPERRPPAPALARLARLADRRVAGEPLAYLTGTREFWSLPLRVTPDTLVPRPETERLVELALAEIPPGDPWRVADLGTGSGAIALAVAVERPRALVVATDRSEAALAVARENARRLGVTNVSFRAGDWTAPVAGERFDLVLSNPPYVREDDDALAALAHEPRAALASGPDGLDAIRALAAACPGVLRPGALLLLEHGADQAAAVAGILRERGFTAIHCTSDHAGLPRVTGARSPAATVGRERDATETVKGES